MLLPILAIGALLVFVIVAALVLWARKSQPRVGTELGAEARWLLRPLRELRDQLSAIAERSSSDSTAPVIAREAVAEADHILESAQGLVRAREALKRGLKGQGEAETNLERLKRELPAATSDSERQSLESAISARESEIGAYASAKQRIADIDGKLRHAEATLSELKARLATGMVSNTEATEQEFTDMVTRLKSLGQSFDEAEETLGVTQS